MKKRIIILMLFVSTIARAQSPEILSGDLKALKGISEYNITFDYTELNVHGYETEENYLQDKHYREESPEKAIKFREGWFNDRQAMYEPAFIEYFNARFPKGEIKAAKNPDAKYTRTSKPHGFIWVTTKASPLNLLKLVPLLRLAKLPIGKMYSCHLRMTKP